MHNQISEKNKTSRLVRTISGVVFICLLLPAVALGGWLYFLLISFFTIVACHERLEAPGKNKFPLYRKGIAYVFRLLFAYGGLIQSWAKGSNPFKDPWFGFSMDSLYVSLIGLIVYLLILFSIAIFSSKVSVNDVTYLFTRTFLIGFGFQSIFFLRYFGRSSQFSSYYQSHPNLDQRWSSCYLMVFTAVGTWFCDVGAYFSGRLFGKHKRNPRVSPNKTWEGFVGGSIFSIGFTLARTAFFEYVPFFSSPLLPGLRQFSYSPLLKEIGVFNGQAWPILVIASILSPIIGNIGGFLFSLIKRTVGIKDYGKIRPGHGGIIDRFDSLLTNAAVRALFVLLLSKGFRIFL